MKRKNVKLLALILVALLSFSFTSCSKPAENKESITDNETQEYDDQIIIGRIGDAAYLDPNQPIGNPEVPITQLIYESLVTTGDDNKSIVGLLATDWTISDDGLIYTFNLKPNVKFSDGTPVSGEDWVWSLLRARDCKTSSYRFVAEPISEVTADDKTVKITLKQQNASFLAGLCNFNMVVQSKAHFEKVGEVAYSQQPLGTGPYSLKEWKKEEHIILEKNPNYHVEGLPKTQELKYTVIPDDNTRLMQLQAGQIDIMDNIPFSLISSVKADANLKMHIFQSTQIRYLILNTLKEPLDNVLVRKAIEQAIDKSEIAALVADEFGAPVASIVPEAEGKWWNSTLKPLEYDPEKAKEMLAEAGYPDGIKMQISVRSGAAVYEQIATLLKSQFAKANIELEIVLLERAAISEQYETLSHQTTLLQWLDDILDPSGVISVACDYDQMYAWYTGLQDKELEDLCKAAGIEMDEGKRIDMYWELQERINNNANIIPLFKNDFAWAASSKVQNIVVTPFSILKASNLVKYK